MIRNKDSLDKRFCFTNRTRLDNATIESHKPESFDMVFLNVMIRF